MLVEDPTSACGCLRARIPVAEERRRLTSNAYYSTELVMMLERGGFAEVEVRDQCSDLQPRATDDLLGSVAQRCTAWSRGGRGGAAVPRLALSRAGAR